MEFNFRIKKELIGKSVIIKSTNENYERFQNSLLEVVTATVGGSDYDDRFLPMAKCELAYKGKPETIVLTVYEYAFKELV